ncbi:MAG: DNA-binding protein [Pseudonocardiales bacterium]|nr:DNA-binding protein [Pseudonocardiales bacterium]
MTTEEAAELLCVSYSWLKKAAHRREVPCTHIGRAVRFSSSHIEAIIAAGERPPLEAQGRGSARSRL